MCDVYDEACFSQKIFTNELNIGLLQLSSVEKTIYRVETLTLQQRKKFQVHRSIKKEFFSIDVNSSLYKLVYS